MMITNELTRLKSHHYIYSDFNLSRRKALATRKKQYGKFRLKIPNLAMKNDSSVIKQER